MLILCTGNSARSQMAETILRHLANGAIEVQSAGTAPAADIHPFARRAVKNLLGLDMNGQSPKPVDRFVGQHFEWVITVCDRAADTCPVFPGARERIRWSVDDPAAVHGTDEEKQHAFDATAASLLARMQQWLTSPAVRARVERRETNRFR